MTPQYFLQTVVRPNVAEFGAADWDERLAVNAILTLDAFFGVLYAALKAKSDPSVAKFERDGDYRDQLADTWPAYRVLRDTAFSIKHGELTGKMPRQVSRIEQVGAGYIAVNELRCGSRESRLLSRPVFIRIPSSRRQRALHVVNKVLAEAEKLAG
jgi:hypothetical protein